MAGTAGMPVAREDRNYFPYRYKELDDPAAWSWWTVGEDEAGKQAIFPKSNVDGGNGPRRLQAEDSALFVARCRYHVTSFHYLVFLNFLAELTQELDPRVASALSTVDGVLSTLDALELVKGSEDAIARAYTKDYEWVTPTWEGIVKRLELSTSDYAAVREFEKYSGGSILIDDVNEEDEAQALRLLESGKVPVEVKAYKEPLIKLLKILIKS